MISCIFVLCISSIVLVNSQHDHRVNVAVYYEAMCSDSIKFVTKELYPALQKPALNKHVNLTLVPYGKTKIVTNATGDYFDCHHGPAECRGNKIHVCALDKIPRDQNSDISKVAVDFVNCLLGTVDLKQNDTIFPVKTCAESQHVLDYVNIENCANGVDGTRLLKEAGQKTELIQQELKSSPTIVFGGNFNQAESSKAEKNFVQVLCGYITHDKPAECKGSGAKTHKASLGISLMLIVTYLVV